MPSNTQPIPVAPQWAQSGPPPSSYDPQRPWNSSSSSSHQQWLPQQDLPLPPPGQGPGQWVWAPGQTSSPQSEQPPQAGPSHQRSMSALQDEKRETDQKSMYLEKPPSLPPRRSLEQRPSASTSQLPGAYPGPPQQSQDQASFPPNHQQEQGRSASPPETLPPPPTYADLFAGETHPVPAQLTPLPRPMCLPQIASGFDAPFVRAHGPDAEAAGVSEEDWLAFLDALNIAMTASPPLRIVDLVGYAIGFVPNPYTFVASIFLRQTSQAGMHKLQKTLTDRLLEHANVTFFEPRGLKVRLMKTAAMRRFCEVDPNGSRRGQLSGIAASGMGAIQNIPIFGKIAGQVAGRVGEMLNHPQPGRPNGNVGGTIIRKTNLPQGSAVEGPAADNVTCSRLNDLAGSIAPVCFDVPPPRAPENAIDRLIAMAESSGRLPTVDHDGSKGGFKQIMGRVGDTTKNRTKMKGVSVKDVKSLKNMRKQVMKANKHLKKEEMVVTSTGKQVPAKKQKGPVRRNGKNDAQEMLATEELVWVVLFNKEHDTEIRNTQLADNMQDETYNDQQWQEEMARETQGRPAGPQYKPYQPPERASTRQILMQK